MKLYYAPGTCALACWIALRWAGAEFEAVKADYASDEFKRINPLANVPALDIGGKRAMTQSEAILLYVAERYPAAALGAEDSMQGRFEFNETLSFLTGDFHPAFWPYFTPRRFTTDTAAAALAQVRAASELRIERVMQHLEHLIGDGRHVHGGRRTVADPYAYVMARWTARLSRSWKDYPGISRLFAWMEDDADVQEVLKLSAAG